MFGIKDIKFNIWHLREDMRAHHDQAKRHATMLFEGWSKSYREVTTRQDKEIADLKATVQALREAHNELYRYDVSKRYKVFSPILEESGSGGWISLIVDPSGVTRLAKTSPQAEPIPVTPAKPARRR